MNKPGQKLKPPVSPAVQFGGEIQAALAEGASPDAMTLRLTLNDGRRLRRDQTVPLDQIRYAEGTMHFMGVRVVEGGIEASVLEQGGQA